MRNDVSLGDRDGDGLGDALEASLGLCDDKTKVRGGFSCSLAFDQRDTDGDGISDGWEVLGHRKPTHLTGTDQPLPYWGADPRHKDLFWEVDYTQKKPSDPMNLRYKASAAVRAHAGYAFKGNAFSAMVTDPVRQQDNAGDLDNPDRQPGINLHIDNGTYPGSVAEWTIYGDWGGYTAYPVKSEDCVRDDKGAITSCKYPEHHAIWDTSMSEVRYGIFKWVLGYPTGGGATPWGFSVAIGINTDARRQADVLAHEGGHSLGLGRVDELFYRQECGYHVYKS